MDKFMFIQTEVIVAVTDLTHARSTYNSFLHWHTHVHTFWPGLFFFLTLAETGMRAMFYHPYEPIEGENESKLSSQGSIRTDLSNTEESFNLDVEQYIDFCDEPCEE